MCPAQPSRAVSTYDRDVSHEQAESYSKTQESLSRVSSQVKAMDRMTSYHKGKRKEFESTKGSKTGNGGIDWTLRKRDAALAGKERWGGRCLRN